MARHQHVLGAAWAAVLVLTWLGLQLQSRDRRHLVEWTTNLRLLSAEEFEWLVGEVFRRDGWLVEETGRQDGPDGNIELRLRKGTEQRIVQCKRWQSWPVGVDEVRMLAGTLARGGMPSSAGILVTLSGFTEQALSEAKTMGLRLIGRHDLYAKVEKLRRTEPCATCGAAMVLDRSSYGWWFRCVTPNCSGKRDLGRDPVRAVELLTEASPGMTFAEPAQGVDRAK